MSAAHACPYPAGGCTAPGCHITASRADANPREAELVDLQAELNLYATEAGSLIRLLLSRGWIPPWEVETTTEWALMWGDEDGARWRLMDEDVARRKADPERFGDRVGKRTRRTVAPTPWEDA